MSREHTMLLEIIEEKSQAQFKKKYDIGMEKENLQND